MGRKLGAEFFGTFWLVFGGCGSAVLAATFPDVGIGFHGVALAFGLTVLTMAFAVGHISGGHFNPAVTIGLVVGGRHPAGEAIGYIIAQVLGAIAAAAVLYLIASGQMGYAGGLATNGYGDLSPGKYSLLSAFVIEVVMTAFFLIVNGGLLFVGERLRRRAGEGKLGAMTWPQALLIGLWQCTALIPGISRSGATMVGGLLAGLHHREAAHFSFLIATPIILGAGVLEVPHLFHQGSSIGPVAWLAGLVAGGSLEIPIARTYPLEQVRDAFRELAARHSHGKIVLLP